MVFGGFNIHWILLIAAVLMALRWVKPSTLIWLLSWWLAIYAFVRIGFAVPIPGSVRTIYMMIATGSLLAYASSSRERWDGVMGPIQRLATDPSKRLMLFGVVLLIPAIAAFNVTPIWI